MDLALILSIVGIVLSIISIVLAILIFLLTRPRLRIKRISVGMLSTKIPQEQNAEVHITTIEIEVENVGPVSAANCHGLVHFSKEPSLPLRPSSNGTISSQNLKVTIEPLTRQRFTAVWHFSPEGAVTGGRFTYGEFIEKCLPAKIIVYYANTSVEKWLSLKKLRSDYERFQRQLFEQS